MICKLAERLLIIHCVDSVSSVKQWMLLRTDRKVFLVLENDDSFLGREVCKHNYRVKHSMLFRKFGLNQFVAYDGNVWSN